MRICPHFSIAGRAKPIRADNGTVDAAIRNDTNALAGKSKLQEISGMVNTSRWGVRGTENLGSGLKTNFILESGDGIASNRYNTYALLARYLLSKRTFLYAAFDHETATINGGLATVSGGRGNTGITAGIQMRF